MTSHTAACAPWRQARARASTSLLAPGVLMRFRVHQIVGLGAVPPRSQDSSTSPRSPLCRLVGLTAIADDVARLRQVLARQEGPTILTGHSYGGQIITALGADTPNVAGLVYIAAFGLDEGESLGALLRGGPPTPALANMIVDEQGFAWLPEEDFVRHFAGDVDPAKAKVMYAVQQGLSMGLRGRDGRPGLEVASVLVPGGDE